jgi:hypothetical protein
MRIYANGGIVYGTPEQMIERIVYLRQQLDKAESDKKQIADCFYLSEENLQRAQKAEAEACHDRMQLRRVIEKLRPDYNLLKEKQSYLMYSYERLLYAKIQAAITALDHIGDATEKAGDQP